MARQSGNSDKAGDRRSLSFSRGLPYEYVSAKCARGFRKRDRMLSNDDMAFACQKRRLLLLSVAPKSIAWPRPARDLSQPKEQHVQQ
jgi:hypothetical protein